MAIRGLDWQTVQVPLAAGLQTKVDVRAMQPPGLLVAKDVQFDEVGGLQTRYPYSAVGAGLTNIRRIVNNGSEIVAFTKTGVYSWSEALGEWVSKGTHLAVKVDETGVFATSGDQLDADRAELDGVIIYSWIDSDTGLYVAAVDKETGSVLLSPLVVQLGALRARLVALTTKVLLVYMDGGTNLMANALDPADPGAAILDGLEVTALGSGISSTCFYDVVRVGSTDTAILAARRTTTTSYSLLTIDAALTVTATTKARTCTGAIAVSVEPTGTQVQVIRANATAVEGDLITISGFADVYTNQAVGTTPTNPALCIAACHRSVQDSGVYRCYAFWSSDESATGAWHTSSNWVSTGNTLGTAAVFKRRWAPRARAFDRDGEVYVWGAFFGATQFDPFGDGISLQSTYFLLRDDAFIAAKAVLNTAGAGRGGTAYDGNGWIPGCQDLGSGQYAFAALSCRVIKTGGQDVRESKDYAARSPRDVVFTFDSNDARRTALLGSTLYIACGEGLLQYDGAAVFEVGFHQAPWYVVGAEQSGGSIATNGTYAIKNTWRAANARGEVERSAAVLVGAVSIASQPGGITLQGAAPLYLTHRTHQIAWEAWRTKVDPSFDSPFYLVTDRDPSNTSNPNRYVLNDTSASSLSQFNDELADADIEDNEQHPDNAGILETTQPPAAKYIAASADRLFIAGIAGDPRRVWYSKQRLDGHVVAFNDALTFTVPREGGDITGLEFNGETLCVFCETAVYGVVGSGLDNLGQGQNYEARRLPGIVGAVSQEGIAAAAEFGVVFKSRKGWCLLPAGFGPAKYVGAPVADYDSDTVVAVHVLEDRHQVRCLTSSRMLVWDYLVDQWAEWTIGSGVHACVWDGTYHYATATSISGEVANYDSLAYGLDIETGWIKLNDLQGYGRVRKIRILGENAGIAYLRVRVARNYATSFFQDKVWTIDPGVSGDPLEVLHSPSIQQCEAIKVRITAVSVAEGGGIAIPSTGAVKLTGLGLELGFQRGLNKRLPVAQKQ